jgi:hypothetical protein
MKCPFPCKLRTNEDLCTIKAEMCKLYNTYKAKEREQKEWESRFGEMQEEDVRRVRSYARFL